MIDVMQSTAENPMDKIKTTDPETAAVCSTSKWQRTCFEASEATIETVHQAIFQNNVSCRSIVEAFLERIEEYNSQINAIICLNPDALREADRLDSALANNSASGMLFGVPILLKDNFDASGMPTTAGSRMLKDLWPLRDATVVQALRKEGAIILGKTNLHEFALEGLTISSLGGQTRNPYDLTRTPGGSSGGSGAAVAASFAVMATGTDTVNSLRSPASANSLYSFRPTSGLISTQGVVPVSSTQDAVGMIGRCLRDICTALIVMSALLLPGNESLMNDYKTDICGMDPPWNVEYPQSKPVGALRVGVLRSLFDHTSSLETDPVNQAMDQVLSVLRGEGATVLQIDDAETFNIPNILATMDMQMYEISEQIDSYLTSTSVSGKHPSSFSEIFNCKVDVDPTTSPRSSDFLVIPSQHHYIRTALTSNTSSPEYLDRKARISLLTQALHKTFHDHKLHVLIHPQQRNLVVPIGATSQYGRNGILAAVTGSPVVCIPIGFSQPTSSAPIGLPIGMEILGLPRTEMRLFEVARAIDDKISARRSPVLGHLSHTSTRYQHIPEIVAQGLSDEDVIAYPPGKIR